MCELFAHNGMLPGIEDDPRFEPRRFRRIGDTDSEWAWRALLDRLAPLWEDGVPSVTARAAVIRDFAAEVRPLGQIGHDVAQHVALVASVPLSAEPWRPLAEGELLVLRGGQIWSDRGPSPNADQIGASH